MKFNIFCTILHLVIYTPALSRIICNAVHSSKSFLSSAAVQGVQVCLTNSQHITGFLLIFMCSLPNPWNIQGCTSRSLNFTVELSELMSTRWRDDSVSPCVSRAGGQCVTLYTITPILASFFLSSDGFSLSCSLSLSLSLCVRPLKSVCVWSVCPAASEPRNQFVTTLTCDTNNKEIVLTVLELKNVGHLDFWALFLWPRTPFCGREWRRLGYCLVWFVLGCAGQQLSLRMEVNTLSRW